MEAERALVEAAQKDPNRFADLYEIHFNRVYAFIVSRVRDRFDAQDLTADVFHQALANIKQYQWRGVPFVSWLLKIASNVIVDRYRRASRDTDLPATSDVAEIDFDQGANHARLFECVNRLPADQKRVIVLRFAEQKSIREIAEQMNRTEGAIKQLQFRALQNLRMRMGETNG
ncbi:MAG TPA: RNA polymerase sigma factor [Acidobacteriota bacterium]|nr:RNA polymerase sigma factor [Acidobacteriota bacterium]